MAQYDLRHNFNGDLGDKRRYGNRPAKAPAGPGPSTARHQRR